METIKSYLEAMFANMPNTKEVLKAKNELLVMMEDKYNEMIESGISENEAVGTVISEFGNLDELADDLGLKKEVKEVKERTVEEKRRFVPMDEVRAYLAAKMRSGLLTGLGVMFVVSSIACPIFGVTVLGVSSGVMMLMVMALGIALFIFNGILNSDWGFITREKCAIDMATAQYVRNEKRRYKIPNAVCKSLGIIMCGFCWLPAAMHFSDRTGAGSMFICLGIGLLLIISSTVVMKSYKRVLYLNDEKTVSGNYGKEDEVNYMNKTATVIMEVYWVTVTCIYLSVSFLTAAWGITWIIWPIAAILNSILGVAFTKEEGDE
ncbi:MAG: hypothetical protein J6U37_00420 [Lachnospiraceae bacterium]|nr:hypothetical protein [Lachnospiraceae bacterium]